jgi:hypothetical protein
MAGRDGPCAVWRLSRCANLLSLLYTLAMGVQKASFQAGERHAMVCIPLALPCPSCLSVGKLLHSGKEFESGRRGPVGFLEVFFELGKIHARAFVEN